MRYFLDTEFIETGRRTPIQLISLGIVSQDHRELYLISGYFNPQDASEWVETNVLSKLDKTLPRYSPAYIAGRVEGFIGDDPNPEFWGYYCSYDWVVFCQLFGTMMDLPKHWPKYCMDLKQWAVHQGNPLLPSVGKDEHNALADARWNRNAWLFLDEYEYARTHGNSAHNP